MNNGIDDVRIRGSEEDPNWRFAVYQDAGVFGWIRISRRLRGWVEQPTNKALGLM